MLIPVQSPYDWPSILAFFTLRAIPGVECASADRYERSIVMNGEVGRLAVGPATGGLEVTSSLPGVIDRVSRMFDTEHDPARLAKHFANDEVMLPLVTERPGLRIPNAWDGFELAVRAVLGQQITVIQAAKLAGKLVTRYGRRIADTGLVTHLFPEPAALIDQDIAALGMPGSRGETIRNVARAALADPTIFAPGGTAERLRGMRGIGDWTAQYIAMRALGDRDAFPASDVGLLRAMAGKDRVRPTPKALLARAELWRPYRAYAAQHLWAADAVTMG
ncbi:MAG: DNA-3-methyladenine glycosylase [Myxococcota bacterium]